VERVVTELVEGTVGEAVDDGQNGGRHVSEEDCPPVGDGPVLALSDNAVQVKTELVALRYGLALVDS
jgi:hypothetical protein